MNPLIATAIIIQRQLFPMLEKEIGPLSDQGQRFVQIVELSHPERFMAPFRWKWIGYKLHMDVIDGDIPVSAILTSASLHDSQAAIPLAQITRQRIPGLYDLMVAAYDAKEINLVPCNRDLEVALTEFLDRAPDVTAFCKNAGLNLPPWRDAFCPTA